MRIVAIKAKTDLQGLKQQLLRRPASAGATLDRIKALNPHLDLSQLKVGDVLLIPDTQDVKSGAGSVLGAESLQSVLAAIDAGIAASATGVGSHLRQLKADRATLAAALRTAAAKRVIVGGTPGLKERLKAVDAQFTADEQAGADTAKQLAQLRRLVAGEFEKLRKMLS